MEERLKNSEEERKEEVKFIIAIDGAMIIFPYIAKRAGINFEELRRM